MLPGNRINELTLLHSFPPSQPYNLESSVLTIYQQNSINASRWDGSPAANSTPALMHTHSYYAGQALAGVWGMGHVGVT